MPPTLLLMPAATHMLANGSDPALALTLFRSAAACHIFLFAASPVLLAPAVGTLFGTRDASAIYQRAAVCESPSDTNDLRRASPSFESGSLNKLAHERHRQP